jgi:chorismate dehydratase
VNLTIGHIPYLNMVPFHQGFGPQALEKGGHSLNFRSLSPRALGLEAEAGQIDAGAMSLVDTFRLSDKFRPLGDLGVGVRGAAGSVLLFSREPIERLQGLCAVTDETSTSFRLLQVLLEKRYGRTAVNYGRVASSLLYDGSADALLLIGDEALRARAEGIKGLPVVTDLATAWFEWQGSAFVFARWVIRRGLPGPISDLLYGCLEKSLDSAVLNKSEIAELEAPKRGLTPSEVSAYWDGFAYRLAPEHEAAIANFKGLVEKVCLTT